MNERFDRIRTVCGFRSFHVNKDNPPGRIARQLLRIEAWIIYDGDGRLIDGFTINEEDFDRTRGERSKLYLINGEGVETRGEKGTRVVFYGRSGSRYDAEDVAENVRV